MKTVVYSLFALMTCFTPSFAIEKFTVITIPKCGTHLLIPLLCMMTEYQCAYPEPYSTESDYFQRLEALWDRQFIQVGHHPRATSSYVNGIKKREYKTLFLVRDLRDQLVSLQDWWDIHEDSNNIYHLLSSDDRFLELLTNRMRILSLQPTVFHEYVLSFLDWIDVSTVDPEFCCIIRYENLIGPKGGGSKNKQIMEILKIATHIGLSLSLSEANIFADRLNQEIYGSGPSFRNGRMGSWIFAFNEEIKEILRELIGDRLIDLGYEADKNW